jgi:hypothetical protein
MLGLRADSDVRGMMEEGRWKKEELKAKRDDGGHSDNRVPTFVIVSCF